MKINKLKIIIFISIIFLIFFTPISFAEVKTNKSVDINKKSINSIDLSKEQKIKLEQIQKEFKKEIENINSGFAEKRKELSLLAERDASNEELQSKIKEITSLKSKQLWLIIKNKKSLDRILGKKKNKEFLAIARKKFLEHNKKYKENFPPVPISPPFP